MNIGEKGARTVTTGRAPITAVAYGLEYPEEGPLKPTDFTGGKQTVEVALRRLQFPVVHDPYRYLVLTENEVHARPEFAKWQDVTGERYHFPNGYRNKVVPGREFVYYKGARRKGGRAIPEYFGWGRVGDVNPDPATVDLPAAKRHWIAEIEDYRKFERAVRFRAGNSYIEVPDGAPPKRYWEAGVRLVTRDVFQRILRAAGIEFADTAAEAPPGKPVPSQVPTVTEAPLDLLVLVGKNSGTNAMRKGAVFAGRKSGRAKEIGDKAERIVFDWLRSRAQDDRGRTKIHRVASEGKTPGWDIEDRRSAKYLLVYEVKGTSGSQFPAIEVTANEWVAAEAHGVRYHLVLVSNCESATPRIAVVKNPWQLLHDGYFSATPIGFRLERVRA